MGGAEPEGGRGLGSHRARLGPREPCPTRAVPNGTEPSEGGAGAEHGGVVREGAWLGGGLPARRLSAAMGRARCRRIARGSGAVRRAQAHARCQHARRPGGSRVPAPPVLSANRAAAPGRDCFRLPSTWPNGRARAVRLARGAGPGNRANGRVPRAGGGGARRQGRRGGAAPRAEPG